MGMIIDVAVGLIWLVTLIWAITHVVGSETDAIGKVFWIVILIVFPFFGVIIWWFIGPKRS